jgi:hypothetical protein
LKSHINSSAKAEEIDKSIEKIKLSKVTKEEVKV